MSVKKKFIDLVLRGKNLLSPVTSKATEEFKKLQGETKLAADQLKQLEATQAKLATARGLELYAEQAEKALAGARAEVTRLAREMDLGGKATKEQSENLSAARRSANQLQTEYNKLSGQLSKSKSDLQQSGVNTKKLSSEQDRLQKEILQSNGALQQKRTKLRELSADLKKTSGSTGKFGESLSGITTRILAFGAAYIGINQVKGALTNLFTTGDKFERLDIQLAGVMGSIEAGEQAGSWIKDFAKNTPLQLDQVTETFVRLKNFGLNPMDGVMQSIIDQSEKLGGGYERVQGISLALGQAWAKQKLQGEEILQLIERGVPVWQLLENVTGKNTAELQKLSSAGALGRDVMKQLIDEIGRSAEGQAAKGMGTLSGLISNAKDELEQFYALVANSGALDWLKGQLSELNKTIARMTQSGELKALAKSISDGVVATGEAIKSLVTTVFEWRKAIIGVGAAWALLKVGSFFKGMITGSRDLIASLLSLIGTKKAAAAANALYAFSFNAVIAQIGRARVAANAWVASLTGVGAMLSKAGIFGGIAYGVYQIGRLAVATWDLIAANNALRKSENDAAASKAALSAELEKVNLQLGTNYKSTKDLFDAQEKGLVTLNKSTGAWEAVDQSLKQHSNTLADYQNVWDETANKLEQAYKQLGIASTKSLQEASEQARLAYETIAMGNEPIEQQQAAFLKYAESAAKAAKASGDSLPIKLQEQAATLGLTKELGKLTEQKISEAQVTDLQAKAYGNMGADIQQTKDAIAEYKKTLDSSTASSEDKALASQQLAKAEAQLKEQTNALNEVKQLELSTLAQLKLKYDEYTRQMDELDELYRNNGISAAEYLQQKERYVKVLNIISPMLAGMKDTEQQLEQQTDLSNKSLAEQQRILENLAGTTGKAIQYTSLLAQAQQAINQDFNLSAQSTEQLSARVKELSSFIVQNNRVSNIWWTDLARASNQAFAREKQIINETLLIRKYTEQLASSSVSINDVARISKALNYEFNQLGDSDLAPLRNAITDAENRILSLRDGLQGTFRGLQDELDRLQNNQAAIEKRNYETQLADLNAKLKQAQESNDQAAISAAKQSLALAKEIYAIKTSQIQAEAQSKANSNSATDPAAQTAKPRFASEVPVLPRSAIVSNSNSNSAPSQTVRLELAMPSGSTYQAQMGSNDVNRMLAEIERAASTSL
ncbi:tape measure protein [Rheinheimera sp. MMS21-TC3]|uniref:tape measure protein n=1 Tax=Rheinheimera sp. MMS21-TC3 TaxID=3072790 RepID=UPI0028C47853|nr:tape measure protein [Rheinheimera sp. MMS21-TC3]WNO60897.1 tape measure protein [Rheinheimera sp. MMS21-TC3]